MVARPGTLLTLGVLVASLNNQHLLTTNAFQFQPLSSIKVKSRRYATATVRHIAPEPVEFHEKILPPLYASVEGDDPQKISKRSRVLNLFRRSGSSSRAKQVVSTKEDVPSSLQDAGPYEVTTIQDLDNYFNDTNGTFSKKNGKIDNNALLASLSVKGDTQIVGSISNKDMVHPVVQLVHERRREIEKSKESQGQEDQSAAAKFHNKRNIQRTLPPKDGFRVALAVEGGGMRGCVTAGMVSL